MSKYRIITFDGGGVRGIICSILFKRLYEHFPNLINITDLFSGTSSGALMTLGLSYGLTPEKIVNLYTKKAAKFIFTPKYPYLCRPKHDNKHLIQLLNYIFPKSLRLKDLEHHVLIPSFKIIASNSGNYEPVFYNNFPNSNTKYEKVIDVALYSSSAPIYFPSYKNHIDGGVIANNPSIAAISIAKNQDFGNKNLDEIYLLSIGTGFYPLKINVDTSNWGTLQWINCPHLIGLLFDCQTQANIYYSSNLLGNQYFRINPKLPYPIILDDYKEVPYLRCLAENYSLESTIEWLQQNWF
ncbi:patatin-like phospholipase family protein [Clostridium ganghwense]|uniref:Patatin-like phospholipase family protein n=1 Tax=Clostridium ganghwense TaxID=312089 RepID=A0ABT4CJL5_9CLOT|nr:patatin-like phospholipase family protein [Clostridium ganghwense]MCY6369250.1 patatin-like phospholipase family protein [Clostridium ganghwense]